MEKIISVNNENEENKTNKMNLINTTQKPVNSRIKKYKIFNNSTLPKKSETNFYNKVDYQTYKTKKVVNQNIKENKENNNNKKINNKAKEKEKGKNIILNSKAEIKPAKAESKIMDIKVNKINFFKNESKNIINTSINNNININNNISNINYTQISNENSNLKYNHSLTNENNYMTPINKNQKSIFLYKYNNKTSIINKKLAKEESKKLYKFKELKTFLAHIDIFLSLFLKKNFKIFIQRMKSYEKKEENDIKSNNNDNSKNNLRPIVNVNNAHCSLYCSINVNQDKLINTLLNNQNISAFSNNTYTPITKKNKSKIQNNALKTNEINIIKRNKNFSINQIGLKFNTDNMNEVNEEQNKLLYMSKKALHENNKDNDIINEKIYDSKSNISNNIKVSPIKEMNINLGQLNLYKLKDINKFNNNQIDFERNNTNDSRKIFFTKINPAMKHNYNVNHVKNSLSDLYQINLDKNKIKKLKNAKSDVYMKPKENSHTKSIREIKIHNKLSPKKFEVNHISVNSANKSFNRVNNILNKVSKNNNEKMMINEQSAIKKIYIKRGNQITNNFNHSNMLLYNTTFINFKADNEKNINDVLLIKKIQTSDNRIFINVKYMTIKNPLISIKNPQLYSEKNEQIVRLYSISIINNKISLNKELYENLTMYKLNNSKDIIELCSFDNDKNKKFKNIINIIYVIKNIISKKILKHISKKYAKRIILKSLLTKNYNKNIKIFFSKFADKLQIKTDKNNHAIYHKINYNDDFNKSNKFQTPKNSNKFKKICNPKIHCKSKPYNLSYKKGINHFTFKKRYIENNYKEYYANTTYRVQKK